jgi:hypothetical protein
MLLATLCVSSCRFQDLTPGNARHDETMLPGVVNAFYQAIGSRDRAALERTTLSASTALMTTDRGPIVLVPMQTVIEVPERRNQGGGVRMIRTELHTDGDVATDRVSVVAKSPDGRREYEASDMITLAHRASRWQVAHVMFGPWRIRSGP